MGLRIAKKWGLTDAQSARLLNVHPFALRQFRMQLRNGSLSQPLPPSVLYRVGHTLAIWRSLAMLFPGNGWRKWLLSANNSQVFKGRSPLRLMLSGREKDLVRLRLYLEGLLAG